MANKGLKDTKNLSQVEAAYFGIPDYNLADYNLACNMTSERRFS